MNQLLRHLRIADLELFLTAARFQNLSRAAEMHNVSQSAASASIKRIEMAFDRVLCHHEKRKFRLTLEGKVLLPKIEELVLYFSKNFSHHLLRPTRIATTHAIARALISSFLEKSFELHIMRPDKAYQAVLTDEADLAFVLNNASWENVKVRTLYTGFFQLYSRHKTSFLQPVLLPEDQLEVLAFCQNWQEMYKTPLQIKTRIPSWSLISDICKNTNEIGFLPDFLAHNMHVFPDQPPPLPYKLLALYRCSSSFDDFRDIVEICESIFQT